MFFEYRILSHDLALAYERILSSMRKLLSHAFISIATNQSILIVC